MENSSSVETSSQSSVTPEISTPVEKMVTISENKFNETIRHSNARVAEKARQEERAKWEQQSPAQSVTPQTSNSSMSADDVRRIAGEAAETKQKEMLDHMQKQQSMYEGQKLATEFYDKLEKADKTLYPALEKSLQNKQEFDQTMTNMSPVVYLANGIEGTDSIINELLENPLKMPSLNYLAINHPELAKVEMRKMAASIKLNQAAAKTKMPNEPLSRVEPSNAVGMDNGNMSVSDFRKQFKSRR